MKFLYFYCLIASMPLFIQPAQSQFVPEPYTPGTKDEMVVLPPSPKDGQNQIWYEDFEGGIPDGWVNENINGFCAFAHTFQGPQGPLSIGMPPLASQSAANGFVILDSDLCSSQNTSGLLTNAVLQSPPIDITAAGNIMLSFQHNFRFCCSPDQTFILAEVSTDGQNWTSFDVKNGVGPNNTSKNPFYQAIDITYLTTGAEQVWIRFRKTGASHYWWMIDDVSLVSFVESDIEIVDAATVDGYVQIPAGQLDPINLGATVRNAGGSQQTNLEFTTTINEYLFQSTLTLASINPAQVVDFSLTEPFEAPGRGIYTVEYSIDQTQQDMVPENNVLSFEFQITDSIYSRTGDVAPGELFLESQPGQTFAVGNRFDIIKPIELTSLSFMFNPSTEPGATVTAQLYKFENGETEQVWTSAELTLTENDISTAEESASFLVMVSPVDSLEPGQYIAVLHAQAQDSIIRLAALTAQESSDNTSYLLTDGEWESTSLVPFINMNFGNNLAECNLQVYFDVSSSLCGTASGKIEAIPLNGQGPYVFQWIEYPDSLTSVMSNLVYGEYEIVVTDAFGCEFTDTVTVADEEISFEYTMSPAICNAGGSILLASLNGREPFTYSWSHNAGLEGPLAEGLSAGLYTIGITDTNGCETEMIVEVTNRSDLPVMVNTQHAYCGSASGTIELVPEAGTAPFNFQWVGITGNQSVQEDLVPGTYSFTVTDANNCVFSAEATIGQDDYVLDVLLDQVNASCGLNNGAVSVEVVNGQAPYQFEWSDGSGDSDLENLAPGTYVLEVKDLYGCPGTKTIEITTSGDMPLVTWEVIDSPGCSQEAGTLLVTPINASDTYIYELISDQENPDAKQLVIQKEAGFSVENLMAGQYRVSVRNDDGCELLLGVNISDADAPDVSAETDMVRCYGMADGAISVSVVGGESPTFLWDTAEGDTIAEVTGLEAGIYTVKITDGNCSAVKSIEITQPEQLQAEASIDHIICANEDKGSIIVSVSGGSAPFSYIWSNGVTEKNLTDIVPGEYSITITDFHECTFNRSYTVEGNEPLVLDATLHYPSAETDDGRIILTVSGGSGSYTYAWEHGAQSSVVTDLAPGSYNVVVTDDVGCEIAESFLLDNTSVFAAESESFSLYPNPTNGTLNIDFLANKNRQNAEIEIFNILGEKVYTQQLKPEDESLRLSLGHLHRGIYIIRINSGETTHQARFLKN
jgi:hypothetical protein